MKYIESLGENFDYYSHYGVVPKTLAGARNSVSRYNRNEDPFTDVIKGLYDVAGSWLENEFGHWLSDSKVLSYDYVTDWLRPKKSPGYPWTLKYPYKVDYWLSTDCEFFDNYWDKLSTSNYIHSICSVSIKEEVRPIEKINRDEIRTIVAMDVNHVVAHSMLCLHQNERLVCSNIKHSSALGLNMLQGGFHRLNEKMMKFGEKSTIELDGKKFDSRFRYYCFEKIRDFRFSMLSPEFRTNENKTRMFNIYQELAFSPLINVDGFVYSRKAGNPSGQACTTPDNTFKNWMDMVVLWHLITPKEYHTYKSFNENVVMCICGDDINISVSEECKPYFNSYKIQQFMGHIDMEYHFADMEFRSNFECSFLGHSYQLCKCPQFGYSMYFPIIDCQRMRSNALIFNENRTVEYSIIRACGLRNETFACEDCRKWFLGYINFLRNKYGNSEKPSIKEAFKNYLTDSEIWKVYTGEEIINLSEVARK